MWSFMAWLSLRLASLVLRRSRSRRRTRGGQWRDCGCPARFWRWTRFWPIQTYRQGHLYARIASLPPSTAWDRRRSRPLYLSRASMNRGRTCSCRSSFEQGPPSGRLRLRSTFLSVPFYSCKDQSCFHYCLWILRLSGLCRHTRGEGRHAYYWPCHQRDKCERGQCKRLRLSFCPSSFRTHRTMLQARSALCYSSLLSFCSCRIFPRISSIYYCRRRLSRLFCTFTLRRWEVSSLGLRRLHIRRDIIMSSSSRSAPWALRAVYRFLHLSWPSCSSYQ